MVITKRTIAEILRGPWLAAFIQSAGTTFSPACSIPMLSRAQWYREQAALALQRGNETRSPYLRAGYDDLGREWLRLAEQAEWIANQQQPPVAKRTSRRNRTE